MLAKHQPRLRQFLQQLLDGSISEKELTEFVQISRSIIQSYLSYFRSSLLTLCLRQGLTITDLAYDCIAEAFAREDKGTFPLLENFRDALNTPLEHTSNQEVFLAYKSFLTRVADAQLARLYAQADPAGAKIHRNIRDCVKESGVFTLERDFRGLVLKSKEPEQSERLATFPLEELERELFERVDHQCTTQQMLQMLHGILAEQPDFQKSVPLVDVVQMFRKVYGADFPESSAEPPLAFEGLTEFEIDRLRVQVEGALKEKIVLTYLAKGKVSRNEAEAMFNALSSMLEDWCGGEESQGSIYEYLHQFTEIDEETYEQTLRTKMEYLVKVARDEFAARLMRDV